MIIKNVRYLKEVWHFSKKLLFYTFFCLVICSCANIPPNFTYRYTNARTGLGTKIDIEGYYVAQHGDDSTFYSMFMFYPNGLFTIATTSNVSPALIECFEKGGKSTPCKYPLWGTYRLEDDTIKTQTIRPEGGGCIIFRDYLITSDKRLMNISDYVEPQYTQMGYMKNYPSFRTIGSPIQAQFFPLSAKRNVSDCPYINKKWFKK